MFSCHFFLISSASLRSITCMPFIMTSHICGIWKEILQMNLRNSIRHTDFENELMVLEWVPDREFGREVYKLLYLKWITNKDLLYSTRNSGQCCAAVWMGGEFGGEWIHVCICMFESLHHSPETITTLLISYTSIQNKKLEKQKPCFRKRIKDQHIIQGHL